MLKKILDYVEKYHMIEAEDTIVAGISGGADSVCLLFVLLEIRKEIPFSLEVVHINHGLRKEAAEDARFVEALCKEKNLPFYLAEENIKERAEQSGLSEEEEGRLVRYQAFESVLGKRKGKIAVAHNSNDRAETMLFHLFRGTGLAGTSGIPPVNGKIIRPLLCVERKEIEEWLAQRELPFCTDCTNEQDIYTRNKIRHHVLGYARENVCTGAVANMNRAADQLLEAEEYLEDQTMAAVNRCVVQDSHGKITVRISDFRKEHSYIQGRLLLWCFGQAAGSKKDLTSAHVEGVKALFKKQGNGELHLPYDLIVYKNYDLGMIQKRTSFEKEAHQEEEYEIFLPKPGESTEVMVPSLGIVEFTVLLAEKTQIIPEKTYTKWFDYDKITKSVKIRTKHSGDYLTINRSMGHKSLQDYFVNEKIPKQERDHIYLLAEETHILWVPGYRISEYYKITEETQRILQVRVWKAAKEERSHDNG